MTVYSAKASSNLATSQLQLEVLGFSRIVNQIHPNYFSELHIFVDLACTRSGSHGPLRVVARLRSSFNSLPSSTT